MKRRLLLFVTVKLLIFCYSTRAICSDNTANVSTISTPSPKGPNNSIDRGIRPNSPNTPVAMGSPNSGSDSDIIDHRNRRFLRSEEREETVTISSPNGAEQGADTAFITRHYTGSRAATAAKCLAITVGVGAVVVGSYYLIQLLKN